MDSVVIAPINAYNNLDKSVQEKEVMPNDAMNKNEQDLLYTMRTALTHIYNDQTITCANYYYSPRSMHSKQPGFPDILDIMFECNKDICTRYLNRRTNQLSDIYWDILDYNGKKDVIAYYRKDQDLVIISRAFKTCKKPLTYYLKLFPNSSFGIKLNFWKMVIYSLIMRKLRKEMTPSKPFILITRNYLMTAQKDNLHKNRK